MRTRSIVALAALAGLASATAAIAVPFTPGNLVVVRVGDGAAPLTSGSTATFLDEYTLGGVLFQTIPLPTVASGLNRPFSNSGTATSEGFLNVANNGSCFTLGGYAVAPGVASIVGTTAAVNNRVVARVDIPSGVIDTTTSLGDAHSTQNIRCVSSPDGSQFYTSGPGSNPTFGARWVSALGATTSQQLGTLANVRCIRTIRGDLYISSASLTFQGISQVGTGYPTTLGGAPVLLPGFPTSSGPSNYDFAILAAGVGDNRIIYVADDRTVALGGGIQKWVRNTVTNTWSLSYTLNTGLSAGCRGVVLASPTFDQGYPANFAAASTQVTMFATTTDNKIVRVVDLGTNAGSPFTTLATGATNTAIRGIRFVPQPVPCPVPVYSVTPGTQAVALGGTAVLTLSPAPATGDIVSWFKVGSPDTLVVDGGSISGATTGVLTINPVAAGDAGRYYAVVRTACDEAVLVNSSQGELTITGGAAPCNNADIAATDSTPGFDRCVDNGDFSLFFTDFFAADCSATCGVLPVTPCNAADIAATDSTPGADGCVDNGDFSLFFTDFFAAVCPDCGT